MGFLLQWLWVLVSVSWAGRVELRVDGGADIYEGIPFVLEVVASEFEEVPEPEVQEFAIDGCEVLGIKAGSQRCEVA